MVYADCDGKEQSPIDIVTSGVSQVAETTPLSFSNYDVAMVELLNNGHTAVSLRTFSVAPCDQLKAIRRRRNGVQS